MFKGIYDQTRPGAWCGPEKTGRAACAALVLLTACSGVFAQATVHMPGTGQTVSPQNAAIAPSASLSLSKAIALALEGNPEVAAAMRQYEATEGQVLQGRARPNPELAYSLEDTRSQTRTQSWQINLPIELGDKRAARTKAAEKAREQAQAELAELKATVRANVISAYFDALTAQERLNLAKDSVALARSSTDTVGKRVAAGKVSPVEETKAKVDRAAAILGLLRLGRRFGESAWLDAAERALRLFLPELGRHPEGAATMLMALAEARAPTDVNAPACTDVSCCVPEPVLQAR